MALDIGKAFKCPFNDEKWIAKIIIGGLLSIVPIISFFAIGYLYRIFKNALYKQEPIMLQWEGWCDLFIRGLVLFIISIYYSFIPIIIGLIGYIILNMSHGGGAVALSILGAFLLIIAFLLLLAVFLLMPFVIAQYAKHDEDFGAAFMLVDITKNALKVIVDYLIDYLIVIAISIGIAIVTRIVANIIGYLLGIVFIPLSSVLIGIVVHVLYSMIGFLIGVIIETLYGMAIAPAYDLE
jgi:hypothetical protein